MLEIGDIDVDPPTAPEPPPRVVIEYRDRGIPWMLVPPLLALSAVIAAVVVYNVAAKRDGRPRSVALVEVERPIDLPDEPKAEPIPVENPPTPPGDPNPPKRDAEPLPSMTAPAIVTPEPPSNPSVRDPAPVGFDPASIASRPVVPDPGAVVAPAPVDRDLAAVGQMGRAEEPPPGLNPPVQPEQVDPDLLPPDPRKARFDRQRRAIEAKRRAEAERFQFHAELAAIAKKLGRKAAPAIHKLSEDYKQEIPAASVQQAVKALERMYAGADSSERINLLRSLGFPETAVLDDLFNIEIRHEGKAIRNGPSKDELYIRSALILLAHPPNRLSSNARSASTPRANIRTGPGSPDPTGPSPPDPSQ